MSPVTKLIRSLPASLSPKEVIAKVKAAGLTTDAKNVSRVRSRAGNAAKKSAPAKKVSAPTKQAPRSGKGPKRVAPGAQSPSDFIRSMPDASPADIMAAAEKAGAKFSRGLIYMVRSNTKKKGRRAGPKPRAAAKSLGSGPRVQSSKAAPRVASRPAQAGGGRSSEKAFLELCVDLGLRRAHELLDELRGKLATFTRG